MGALIRKAAPFLFFPRGGAKRTSSQLIYREERWKHRTGAAEPHNRTTKFEDSVDFRSYRLQLFSQKLKLPPLQASQDGNTSRLACSSLSTGVKTGAGKALNQSLLRRKCPRLFVWHSSPTSPAPRPPTSYRILHPFVREFAKYAGKLLGHLLCT
jgi:hypothetical protein